MGDCKPEQRHHKLIGKGPKKLIRLGNITNLRHFDWNVNNTHTRKRASERAKGNERETEKHTEKIFTFPVLHICIFMFIWIFIRNARYLLMKTIKFMGIINKSSSSNNNNLELFILPSLCPLASFAPMCSLESVVHFCTCGPKIDI